MPHITRSGQRKPAGLGMMDNDLAAKDTNAWAKLKDHFTEAFTGELLSPQRSREGHNKSEWRDKRRRNAYRYILLFIAAIVVPLLVYGINNGHLLTTAGLIILLTLLAIDIVQLSRGRDATISPHWILLLAISLVTLSLYQGTSYALYLLFPLLVGLPILMRMRWAVVLGLLSGVISAPPVIAEYDRMTAAVIGLSMGVTWIASAWLVFSLTEQARRLRSMTITDPLTGAYNRRYLELQAERAHESHSRYRTKVSLLLIDIDHFKRINDNFGHAMGDRALVAFVEAVRSRVRKADMLCRIGGEEFVLLLAETSATQAMALAHELREVVQDLSVLPEGRMTISIGVCAAAMAENAEHWLKLADNALYAAKHQGRNRVQLASSEEPKVVPISKAIPHWR